MDMESVKNALSSEEILVEKKTKRKYRNKHNGAYF